MVVSRVLLSGETVLLDEEDLPKFALAQWEYRRTGRPGPQSKKYVMAVGLGVPVYLHRVVMDSPKGLLVDHRDGDTLNCARANLRAATRLQNSFNKRSKPEAGSSQYRGVSWCRKGKKWLATIRANETTYRLGLFERETDAARKYDDASHVLHGEYGNRNFPDRAPGNIELRAPKKKETVSWHSAALAGEKFTFRL